jgi:hypothetical protein
MRETNAYEDKNIIFRLDAIKDTLWSIEDILMAWDDKQEENDDK